ncbi:MAG: FadR family transcriptional regulator [Deltaproteobacteria bacterium]|nr:FadR family transcriptional regulator [Deltaproteobacteria bacterium]
MNIKFKKMKPIKSYQHVVDEIVTAVCDGTIKEGDRLPSEMKLKEMFDTSRGTIREALRVLEQKGLVSIKTGVKGGATIQKANTKPMSDSVAILIRQKKVSLKHLAEFRKMMEGHISEQAAKIAEKEDIKKLKNILQEAETHIKTKPSGWKEFHKMDARFHRVLASIAKNPLIEANLAIVHDNIQIYFHHYLPWSEALLNKNFKDLCDIVEAVEQQDPAKARRLAQDHVVRFNELMEKNL